LIKKRGLKVVLSVTDVSDNIAAGVKLSLCLYADALKPTLSTFIDEAVAVVADGTRDQEKLTTRFEVPSQTIELLEPEPVPNTSVLTDAATGVNPLFAPVPA